MSKATTTLELPEKLHAVFSGEARYRCAYGGRGSGKTRSFALMTAVNGFRYGKTGRSGVILCGREFMNSLEDSSLEEVKQAIRSVSWLNDYYEIGDKYVRSKDGRIAYVFSGLRYNLDSLKSKAGILIAWVDEAENVSEAAWAKLLPTVREKGSEIWVTWNPERRDSATDRRFRQFQDERLKCVELNYHDNPWFPDVLEQERLADRKRLDDATYRWIWEGAYREQSEAQVFRDCYVVEEFAPQADWSRFYGLDFGFAQDPTACVELFVHDDVLYVHADAGKVGLELDTTADYLLRRMPDMSRYVVRADSARPESISYLKRHGLPRIVGAVKGKGSVEDGIAHIKSYKKVVIHPRCTETLNEFRLYSYKTDRLSGDVLPALVDAHNHYIDAVRYALEPLIKKRGNVGRMDFRL